MSRRPSLLLKSDLLAPIEAAESRLAEINDNIPGQVESDLFREGLFVLAVATVEVMLGDTLAALLRAIPHKLPDKSVSVSKDALTRSSASILEDQIQSFLIALGYKPLSEFLGQFSEIVAVDLSPWRKASEPSLVEIKESRNLLLHNNLRVNALYLAKAGKEARGKIDDRLRIDAPYFERSVATLLSLCAACRAAISGKYGKYTKARLLRSVWEHIFDSPVLKFDKHWEVVQTSDGDEHVRLKSLDFHPCISSTERMFVGVWMNHYSGPGNDHIKSLSFNHLLDDKKDLLLWFLAFLSRYRLS